MVHFEVPYLDIAYKPIAELDGIFNVNYYQRKRRSESVTLTDGGAILPTTLKNGFAKPGLHVSLRQTVSDQLKQRFTVSWKQFEGIDDRFHRLSGIGMFFDN